MHLAILAVELQQYALRVASAQSQKTDVTFCCVYSWSSCSVTTTLPMPGQQTISDVLVL